MNDNYQEVIIRKDNKNNKINTQKKQLKSKIEIRHELLKKKYTVHTKEKS